MYCNRCGKQIPDGSPFCNFCGAPQGVTPPPQYRPQYRQPAPKKSGVSPILITGLIFFSCCLILIIWLSSRSGGTGGSENNLDLTPEITTSAPEITTVSKEPAETTEPTEPATLKRKTSISMTGHRLTQNSVGDNVLIVDYDFYNGEDDTVSFSWACIDQCFQNGVECSTFVLIDGVDTHKQNADIQPGATVNLSICYKLYDLSDVNIVVKELLGDHEYLNQTFSPES